MNIKPILDNWEIPHIEAIRIAERRVFAEHPIPGRQGSLFQDLGSRPATLLITGSLAGDEVRDDFLTQVRTKFQAGTPVTFTADITTATQIQYVVIEELHFEEVAWSPDTFRYRIVLRESAPPPPPGGGLPEVDAGLLEQATDLVDDIGDLTDLLDTLGLPEFSDPTPPLRDALGGVQAALEGLSGAASALTELFGEGE